MPEEGHVTNVYPDATVHMNEHEHKHDHVHLNNENNNNFYVNRKREYHTHSHYNIQPNKRPRNDINSLTNNIANNLKQCAQRDTKDINTMAVELNRNLNAVQFQITTLQQAKIDVNNVTDQRTEELRRISETPGDINIEDLFKLAKEKAIREADRRFESPEMRNDFVEKNSKVIAVTGDPGVGKTTLTKMFSQILLENGDRILPGVKYVFYIQFRYVNYRKDSNVLQFLVKSAQCNWKPVSKYELEELTEKFNAESDKCIFIFDGLDEAMFDLSTQAPYVSLHDEDNAEVFIKNILSGKLFPNALKIFTSRTKQLFELHPSCRPFFILQILGISKDAQLSLCEQICGNNKTNVISHLNANPDLYSLCSVPINCILIMYIVDKSLRENESTKVNTMTDVMVSSLQNYICSEHMRGKKKTLNQLAKLAYNGILKNKVVFDKEDLDAVEIDDSILESFLTSSVTEGSNLKLKIYEGNVRSNFSHLTWEEFFCAVNIIYFLPIKEFKDITSRLQENHFEVVAKFLYGLCNSKTATRLTTIFGRCNDWNKKKEILIQNAIERFPNHPNGDVSRTTPVIKQLLSLFSIIKEIGEPDVITRFNDRIPSVLVIRGDVLPSDVMNLAFILQGVTKQVELHVGSFAQTRFLGDSMQKFTHILLPIIKNKPNLKATRINVSFNKLTHADVAKIAECLHKIARLVIRECHVNAEGCEMLTQARDNNVKKTEIFGVVGIPEITNRNLTT